MTSSDKRNVLVKRTVEGALYRRTPGRRRHRQGAGVDDLTALDPRLHAYRPDLADERLRGEVDAARFVAGRPARIAVAVADIRKTPRPDSGLNTQALYGDDVHVFDAAEGWAWVQAEHDGYVGYVSSSVLADGAERAHARRVGAAYVPLSRRPT